MGGAARPLELAGPCGPLLVPAETDDRLYEAALPSGRLLESVPVGRQPHIAAAIGSTILIGDELANTAQIIVGRHGSAVIAAPLQPGGVDAVDGAFVVVDVRARIVTAYRPDGSITSKAPAGTGPTHVVAGPDGYFYVADTLGGTLLVYQLTGTELHMVGKVGLGRSTRPYGLAADPDTRWVFVALTGTNQLVVGLRLQGGRVTKRVVWATGGQPNSVAVDAAADSAVVTATGSNQVEFIALQERS
jgi:DNA-binding beta-propeller fold protein YncE